MVFANLADWSTRSFNGPIAPVSLISLDLVSFRRHLTPPKVRPEFVLEAFSITALFLLVSSLPGLVDSAGSQQSDIEATGRKRWRDPGSNRSTIGGIMSIFAWIVVGIIAGWLAKMVIPGEGPGGIVGDMVIGIIGAFIGGWVFKQFGHSGVTGINIASIVVAFVGAVILLWIVRMVSGKRARA